jgi:histidinol-phosphate aminotransferase
LLVRAKDGRALHDALVERGVLVRLFDAGMLAGCMRITVGTPDESSWLLDAIKAALTPSA